MNVPMNPSDTERQRVEVLQRYCILDTPAEQKFDDLVKLAAQICGAPIALISLVEYERQWFKAKTGIDVKETPRDISACQYTIQNSDIMIVQDTLEDDRFKTNPLVTGEPHMRFYAGAPLIVPTGERIGTLCVLDTKPRNLTLEQKEALRVLSNQVVTLLELRLAIIENEARQYKLVEKAEQLRLAQEAGGIGVFSVPTGKTLMEVSPEFRKIFGFDDDMPLYTEDSVQLVLPQDKHRISSPESREAGTTSADVEYRIRRANDGAIRWIARRAHFVRDDEGKPLRMTGVVQDITERKNAESAMEESKTHLSLMLESTEDYAIISMNETGDIIGWNYGAERVFEYQPQEVMQQPIALIFTPEDRAAGMPEYELSTAAQKGRASDERWHLRKSGERFYVSGIMTAVKDKDGRVTGFIKIARDMTAQKRAQEQLLEARNAAESANIAKTEFLANMSHEIRTPMNAIIGLSNILAVSNPLTDKQRQYVQTLQMSADSLLGLINDLLDISKIEARSVELEHIPFSITQIIQEIASMMAMRVREKGLTFTGDGDCIHHRMFMGDPMRLRQIILNLCSNAIKFTDKGGVHVSITCQAMDDPNRETICIAVTDTGIGIDENKFDTIFHKFVQADTSISRKYGGTGLGLAITKTLVEIMNGSLTVDSTVDKGSTFTVCLSLEKASDQQVAETDLSLDSIIKTAVGSLIRHKILLVEDYAANVMVATSFLETFGYSVDVANNGLEAVEMVQKHSYAAALMDVQMHGMNGLEATQRIREHEKKNNLPHLHIIGMTAHALSGDRERCLSVGMDDYLSKPFNPAELQAKLEDAVKSPSL